MMRFRPAPEPPDFEAAVAPQRTRIETQLANHQKPDFKGHEKWKDFKAAMAPATYGKCGYCEVDVWAVDRFKGDVEHYRPKGRIDQIVARPDGSTTTTVQFESGYHWLAYEWDNYILSCNPCNSANKKNLFPVKDPPATAPQEGDERSEKPLLLNPFGRKDPGKHLLFDQLGIVGPRRHSKYGRTTIEVCGLNREPLAKKRRRVAKIVRRQLDILENPNASPDNLQNAIETIADLGVADAEHAGMVRSMFCNTTDLPWSFVEHAAPRPTPEFDA
jgi:hypothetical protein